jgi:hypothetical protein
MRTLAGGSTTKRRKSAQNVNALYQADDSPSYTGNQPVYRLIPTAVDQAELKQIISTTARPFDH